jgi:hypothetical protein
MAFHNELNRWLYEPDFASVREPKALEKLPIEERLAWVKFWAEVRELRDATIPPESAPPAAGEMSLGADSKHLSTGFIGLPRPNRNYSRWPVAADPTSDGGGDDGSPGREGTSDDGQ